MNKNCNNFLVFDFETGGLKVKEHPATEFCGFWINGESLDIKDKFSSLIKPYNDGVYTDGAIKSTGISKEIAESEGADIFEVVDKIIDITQKYNVGKAKLAKTIVVGHNVKFDIGYLTSIFVHCKKQKELVKLFDGSEDFYGNFQLSYFDTISLGRAKYANEEKEKFNLTALADYENIELTDAHRAENDVNVTYEIFCNFVRAIRSNHAQTAERKSHRESFRLQF